MPDEYDPQNLMHLAFVPIGLQRPIADKEIHQIASYFNDLKINRYYNKS